MNKTTGIALVAGFVAAALFWRGVYLKDDPSVGLIWLGSGTILALCCVLAVEFPRNGK